MLLYRVAPTDAFADTSPKRHDGRWHLKGDRLIYFSLSPSSAVNECIAHAEMDAATLAAATLTQWTYEAADTLACDEVLRSALAKGWRDAWGLCQPHTRGWHKAGAPTLKVPSAITPAERNLLLHPGRTAPFRLVDCETFSPDPRLADPTKRRRGAP